MVLAFGMLAATLAALPATAQEVDSRRIFGPSRVETAVAVSQALFGDGDAPVVVLARDDDPADSYAATPFATMQGGPILLSGFDSVHPATRAEIDRVLATDGRVVVAGGAAAISNAVTDELRAAGLTVDRIGGATRFDTAVQLAKATQPDPPAIFVADGGDYRFALPAAAMAATVGGVIVLTSDATLPPETRDYIDQNFDAFTDLHAVGSDATVAVGDAATAIYPGDDPYDVAVSLAEAFYDDQNPPGAFTLAAGEAFPDALTGGVYAALRQAPLLLTPKDSLAEPVDAAIRQHPITDLTILGGTAAISLPVEQAALAAANGQEATTSDLDQARMIPGQRTYYFADCPPPPTSPLIPTDATCVTVIATDLDGDGTGQDQLDRVIMYQQGAGDAEGQLTIAGYTTALGTLAPYTTVIYSPAGDGSGPSGGYATECIANVDTDPATELLITNSVGVNTIFGGILEARDGAMAPVLETYDGQLVEFYWAWGGGVNYGSGYRLDGSLFTRTGYDVDAGSPYGWGATDFSIADGVATYIGDQSGSTADPSAYAGPGCPGGSGTFAPSQ